MATSKGVEVFDWWTGLFEAGFGGAVLAVVLLALAVLAAGNAIIWPLVGVKAIFSGKPVELTPAPVDTATDPA